MMSEDKCPEKKRQLRIYVSPDDHTDYMWTADAETYEKAFVEMLDYYLDRADDTANNPPEHQSRWNCDGTFWLWIYQKNKPERQFRRLIERIKSGHVSVHMNSLVLCYGGMSAEAIIRSMYYAGSLERQYDLRFTMANAMENQTLPYGLGMLWVGCGVRYSWRGICNCATRMADAGKHEHPVYWWVGPDGSRVLMKWYQHDRHTKLGSYREGLHLEKTLEIGVRNSTKTGRVKSIRSEN